MSNPVRSLSFAWAPKSSARLHSMLGRFTQLLVGVLSLALLAALYLTNSDWFYTKPGWLDAWYHVGYGLYYDNPLFLNDYYKVSRLPWNLYEFLFRSFLLPIPSEIAIHFSLYVAGAVLAYYVCARLFSTQTGALIGVFTAAFSLLHSNGGTDYQNAPSGPLFFAVIASILWALDRDRMAFVITGVLLATLIHTNTIYIFLVPLFAAIGAWLAWSGGKGAGYIAAAVVWVCAGVVLCTAGLAIINVTFGRSWLFFLPQIKYAYGMAADPALNIWWKPWSMSWVQSAPYLGFIYGMAVIAICEMLRAYFSPRERGRGTAIVIHACYLLEVAIWTYWQTFGRNTAFQPAHHAYPLYGPLLLSLAATIAPRLDGLRPAVLIGGVFAFAALLYLGLTDSSPLIQVTRQIAAVAPIWPATALLILYVALLAGPKGPYALILILALMPVANAVAVSSPNDYGRAGCMLRVQVYDYIVRNSVTLSRTVARPEHVYVWFDQGEPLETPGCKQTIKASDIGYSFTAIGHSYIDQPFPMKSIDELSAERLKSIAREDAIVVAVTADEGKADQLARRLATEGVQLRFDGRLVPARGHRLVPFFVFRTR
jgi:hypothetical protein